MLFRSEYASKTFGQREYLYFFRTVIVIRKAIKKKTICRFYTDEKSFTFVPVSIEMSPIYNYNYVVGIDRDGNPQAIRLCEIVKASITENKLKATETMCELITDLLEKIYEEEYNECSV